LKTHPLTDPRIRVKKKKRGGMGGERKDDEELETWGGIKGRGLEGPGVSTLVLGGQKNQKGGKGDHGKKYGGKGGGKRMEPTTEQREKNGKKGYDPCVNRWGIVN